MTFFRHFFYSKQAETFSGRDYCPIVPSLVNLIDENARLADS